MITSKDASWCFNAVLVTSGKDMKTLMAKVAELELEEPFSTIYSSSCSFTPTPSEIVNGFLYQEYND